MLLEKMLDNAVLATEAAKREAHQNKVDAAMAEFVANKSVLVEIIRNSPILKDMGFDWVMASLMDAPNPIPATVEVSAKVVVKGVSLVYKLLYCQAHAKHRLMLQIRSDEFSQLQFSGYVEMGTGLQWESSLQRALVTLTHDSLEWVEAQVALREKNKAHVEKVKDQGVKFTEWARLWVAEAEKREAQGLAWARSETARLWKPWVGYVGRFVNVMSSGLPESEMPLHYEDVSYPPLKGVGLRMAKRD